MNPERLSRPRLTNPNAAMPCEGLRLSQSFEAVVLLFRRTLYKGHSTHLEGLEPGLLLLQSLLLLLLVHSAEGHACVGQSGHGTGQGACSGEKQRCSQQYSTLTLAPRIRISICKLPFMTDNRMHKCNMWACYIGRTGST